MSDQYQKYLHVKVSINGSELHSYCFEDAKINIGRGSDCQVVLDNPGISRVHATLQREGDNVRVFDQESGNGTFVNGNAVDKAWLTGADTLRIGKFTLNVRLSALRGAIKEEEDEPVAASPDANDQTISLSADDRKKILLQAQTLRANVKSGGVKNSKVAFTSPMLMLFAAGTIFGLLISWLFGG